MFKPTYSYHPGEYIAEELEARKWTQSMFAKMLWISRFYVNDLINGKKNITTTLAILIWEVFETGPEVWINLQKNYDLNKIKDNKKVQEKIHHVQAIMRELDFA